MTPQTKGEIVVAAVGAIAILILWNMNRTAGGGTGAETFPLMQYHQPATSTGSFTAPDMAAGDTFNLSIPDTSYGNLMFNGAGQANSCNCAHDAAGNSTFGSSTDLSAWLNTNYPAVAAAGADSKNWT